ncbi:MAG: hypothetical protein IKS77_03990, partial [Spirochaetales bacterium]|nr:hypothetical protein [Spirochaetales bacterium]
CAAKYGAEKHNRREKEMKHVHSEYSHLNKSWEAEDFKSVADEIRKAKERYSSHHFCRKAKLDKNGKQLTMPAYDKRTGTPIVDPRTGLQKVVPEWELDLSKPKKMPKNSEPIREGVAVITEATTMEQMKSLANQIEQRWGIKTKAIYAHLDEGHEHLVTDKDHQQGKYLDSAEGSTIFLWNHHAHYVFDWTDHETGQCINLNRHDMSELQDMLANALKMERGKKSDKKWRDAHTFKAEQEAIRAKEVAEYTERKKEESRQIQKKIEAGNSKLTKLQEAIDELLSATSVPEEELEAVPFADMTFSFQGSKEPLTVKDLIDMTLSRLDREIRTPIPMLKREEWQKERNARAKEIVTTLQSQLLSVSKLHKKKINDVGKKMYLDVKQKIALAVETDKENMALRQRISELDERAVAREKSRADAAEQKAQEQTMRGNREEKRANEAESRLSDIERFIRLSGASEAYEHWNFLHDVVKKAAQALADWAHSTASIFNHDDERTIGQGIIAQCQLNGLNPYQESNRIKAATSIADIADSIVGSIGRFQWDIAVTRIGQLASEMRISTGGQSVGGSNGNADELTNWDGTKKRGLGK